MPGSRYAGRHEELDCFQNTMEGYNLVKSESMHIVNDPRFFGHNVIEKRIAAFHILAVAGVIMMKMAMGQIFGMKKDFGFKSFDPTKDPDGWAQILGFLLMTLVFWFNAIAVYVTIAQIYHTFKLMTSGPMGFECAAAYYLNKHMIFWRHFAIKCMMYGIPIFTASLGLQLFVKFNMALSHKPALVSIDVKPKASELPSPHLGQMSGFGMAVGLIYLIAGLIIYYIHRKHQAVYCERYNLVMTGEGPQNTMMTQMQTQSQRVRHSHIDV